MITGTQRSILSDLIGRQPAPITVGPPQGVMLLKQGQLTTLDKERVRPSYHRTTAPGTV
ncbi:hypothetical protein SCOR_03270 [Sulfidibacter corallicola]|uniref:Uncharacterized protein n=1 Tax=Sulfidibacter corallicola TaxID=2818388 RepID=A0A8A4TEC1_SULCO|nr:hypothetical protein [Sulfidibacter corallicola]QTD48449.1 hypothetical protein J3U87_22955 [Sulfidibacter corallicola]